MTTTYWEDQEAGLALYHGDMREILPALEVQADLIVADPPYEETSHEWDRWPTGWLDTAATAAQSMWCFGGLRMFMRYAPEFTAAGWKLSHDAVGKDVSILRDRTGGTTKPLTLAALRQRIEEQPDQLDLFDEGGCGCFTDVAV